MTSVPSRPLLLNGSNLLLLILVISCISCASSSVTRNKGDKVVLTPEKTEEKTDSRKEIAAVDTIHWTLVSESEIAPITSDMKRVGMPFRPVFKAEYDIALLLPFSAENYENSEELLDPGNLKFAQFYAGLQRALKELDGYQAAKIQLSVYQTGRRGSSFDRILEQLDEDRPDVIIGPYDSNLIRQTAEFAKERRITVISPWRASSRITENNLFYLQLRPNLTDYYKKMVNHINQRFDRSEVRIIGRDTGEDDAKIRALQDLNEKLTMLPVVQPYQEYLVNTDSLIQADSLVFGPAFNEEVKVFVLPHFSSRDEGFLYSCLRKLYAEKGDHEFYIYTMPLALNSQQFDINLLRNLELRICEYKFPDPRNPQIQSFKEAFFTDYGWLPTPDAYFGYDVMNLVLYGLKNYGIYFHYYMAGKLVELSQMNIYIEPFQEESDDYTQFMVNTHLYIIEFEEDHFDVKSAE
jgi:hypothetical protein